MKTYFLVALVAFALSFSFCYLLIPILRRLKAGQNILVYVEEHKSKSGTPTMGGLAFIWAAVFSVVLFTKKADRTLLITLVIGLSYMAVGFLDDYLKRKHKQNLGLRAWQKFAFQTCIALLASVYCYRAGLTKIYLPFTNTLINVRFWIFPLATFVFLGTVNAVNLTDGLDGLAGGVSVPFFAVFGALILLEKGSPSLACVCFALTGALLAYLLFNTSPASVFMGDTGSLALGGFAACVGLFSSNALYIAIIGVAFVFSVISVVVQVIYYKVTDGKRVFLMAPLHHHFQKKGYSEPKIAYAYFTITLIVGVVCCIFIL